MACHFCDECNSWKYKFLYASHSLSYAVIQILILTNTHFTASKPFKIDKILESEEQGWGENLLIKIKTKNHVETTWKSRYKAIIDFFSIIRSRAQHEQHWINETITIYDSVAKKYWAKLESPFIRYNIDINQQTIRSIVTL